VARVASINAMPADSARVDNAPAASCAALPGMAFAPTRLDGAPYSCLLGKRAGEHEQVSPSPKSRRPHADDSARPFKVSGDLRHSMTGVTAARTVPRRIHAVANQCGRYR